jgi:hypothetical protein
VRYPGPYAGFLGKRYDPLFSEFDKTKERTIGKMKVLDGAPFLSRNTRLADGITLDALQKREGLLKQFNRNQNRLEARGALDDVNRIQQRALSLLTSTKLKGAFDLSTADPKLCDRYDRTLFGASALIADLKLVEAGSAFLCAASPAWDFPGATIH